MVHFDVVKPVAHSFAPFWGSPLWPSTTSIFFSPFFLSFLNSINFAVHTGFILRNYFFFHSSSIVMALFVYLYSYIFIDSLM